MYTVEQKRAYLINIHQENIEYHIKKLAESVTVLNEIMRQKQLELSCTGVDMIREYRIKGYNYSLESALYYVNQEAEALAKKREALEKVKCCSNADINTEFETYDALIDIGLLPAPGTNNDEL